MAVCAWICLPLGEVAVTMQSFGVFLTLCLLGGSKGTAAFSAYLILGAVGLPVFSGFRGGFGVLLGPTGGYLWGFLLACLLFWLLERRLPKTMLLILGQLLCYLCGTAWYLFVYAPGGFWPAVLVCVVPYLLPDALKLSLALGIAGRIKNRV
jgi:biotin transport system substrate-specific component